MVLQTYCNTIDRKKVLDKRPYPWLKCYLDSLEARNWMYSKMACAAICYSENWEVGALERKRMPNKKGGEVSTFFAPNLTMNLTYLCYGNSKVGGHAS